MNLNLHQTFSSYLIFHRMNNKHINIHRKIKKIFMFIKLLHFATIYIFNIILKSPFNINNFNIINIINF